MRTVAVLSFSLVLAAVAQQPLFRVPVRIVEVPVVATAPDGSLKRNLQAGDFRLLDNERPQKIHLEYAERPLSVAVVVQISHSVRAWLPPVQRSKSLLESSLIGETGEASLITYADEVHVAQPMTSDTSALDKAFNTLKPRGEGRRCLDAVMEGLEQLERADAARRRIILIIGQPSDDGSTADLAEVLARTERDNVTVYQLTMPMVGLDLMEKTVAVTKIHGVALGNGTGIMGSVDLGQLVPEIRRGKRRASGKDSLVILESDLGGRPISFRRLRDIESGIGEIGRELHTGYVLTYTPDGAETGFHRIQVQVMQPAVTIRARPGYYVEPEVR